MKKWLTLMALVVAVAGTVGLSSQVAAQPDMEPDMEPVMEPAIGPSDAEYYARVDARLQEVMRSLLTARRSDAHTVALGR